MKYQLPLGFALLFLGGAAAGGYAQASKNLDQQALLRLLQEDVYSAMNRISNKLDQVNETLDDPDRDGVPSAKDEDPFTPYGLRVDSTGKSPDADRDGVPDYLDKEKSTFPGALVNFQGITVLPPENVEPNLIYYRVRGDDTWDTIAVRFGMSSEEVKQLNTGAGNTPLSGQVIRVRKKITSP